MPIPCRPFERPRRRLGVRVFSLAVGALVWSVGATAAAQEAARKPVKPPCITANLIVPWAAGSGSDVIARAIVQVINGDNQTPRLRIRNVVGRNGMDGRAALRAAAADGCHLGLIQPRVVSDFLTGRDAVPWHGAMPVARLTATALALVGAAKRRVTDRDGLMAKLANGDVRAAIAPESQSDFLLRLIERDSGGRFLRVTSDDGRQQLALLRRGVVDVTVTSMASARRLVAAREAVIFAATEPTTRADAPGLDKLGVRGRFAIDRGVMAPSKTDQAIIAWWAERFENALQDRGLTQRLSTFATRPAFLGPQAYTRALEDLTAIWRPLARAGGIYRARE